MIGAIVGEFIAGGGLGSVVETARTQQRIDKVFAAVLLASLLGLGLFGLDQFIELIWRCAALARLLNKHSDHQLACGALTIMK